MGTNSRKRGRREEEIGFDTSTIEQVMRERMRETIEMIVAEELEGVLGARPSGRVGSQRRGYRHGKRTRQLTTSVGRTEIEMARARLVAEDGTTREWRSRTIGRY